MVFGDTLVSYHSNELAFRDGCGSAGSAIVLDNGKTNKSTVVGTFKKPQSGLARSASSPTLDSLIDQFKEHLGTDVELTSDQIDHELLIQYMKKYISNEKEWSRFAFTDFSRSYTRNGVEDISINANVLLLVWTPGQGSFIHDHAAAHCVMKVLKGELTEELFHMPKDNEQITQNMTPFKKTKIVENDVAYINDSLGLHRIMNHSNEIAVTLHLYTPPYAKLHGCNYYEDKNGVKHHVNMSKLYSWKGELINDKNHSTC